MKPPTSFTDRLAYLFDGRLRIRWSHQRGEWHVEYKVSSAKLATFPVRDNDDAGIRARDGYAMIIAVRNGDRMPCPRCGYQLRVPVGRVSEVTCAYCRVQGKDGRYPACFFPLDGDLLLDYLKRLDPQRGWRNGLAKQADAHNDRIFAQRQRQMTNHIEAATLDNFKQLVDIQSVGYTGKVYTGDTK